MTRALITGASGFVGSHLAEYLLEHTDWELDLLIRWRSPLDNLRALVPLANKAERVRFLYADLTDERSTANAVAASQPQYVFHLAAQSYPQVSFTMPAATYQANILGTQHLLGALRDISPEALIQVCSSSEVYGRVPAEKLPIREDCPFHPASPYAISKVGTDLIGRYFAEAHRMNIMVTRMFTHTGPRRGDVFAESSFAKQIAMIEAGQLPPVLKHGNLASMRTVADVRDAVRAYHMLLTVNPRPGEVYNIGGAHSCTVERILKDLFALARCHPVLTEKDSARMRPIDADNQVPDCTKFKEVTGWEPRIPYAQTLEDLLQYWRSRVRSATPLQR